MLARCCAWAAPWSIFIAKSFHQVPKRITLDIDDTFDAVHGGQQLRLFNAHYDEYGFQPINNKSEQSVATEQINI